MRVLLVDHDSEGLETIARAIRGVLELDCVTSKGDALLLLRQNTYDVLIACERAVDGSGLDLLGRTTRTAVPLKRIFAAAPERLQFSARVSRRSRCSGPSTTRSISKSCGWPSRRSLADPTTRPTEPSNASCSMSAAFRRPARRRARRFRRARRRPSAECAPRRLRQPHRPGLNRLPRPRRPAAYAPPPRASLNPFPNRRCALRLRRGTPPPRHAPAPPRQHRCARPRRRCARFRRCPWRRL